MTLDVFKKKLCWHDCFQFGISLRFISQPEVLALISQLAELGVCLSRNNMKKLVLDEYESQKKQLKSKLNNKFVYWKMDACTRQHHHTNYFAINVKHVDQWSST